MSITANGAMSSSNDTECNVFSINTNFEKIVDGGECKFLSNPLAESKKDFNAQFNSLANKPETIRIALENISFVLSSIAEHLDAYMENIMLQEEQGVGLNYTTVCECMFSPSSFTTSSAYCDSMKWSTMIASVLGAILLL